ncbi:hypothetical protein SOVF_117330 [Spinacia oleracea]|nr:hypothetical protein SOVF_117330 [Spinacia oleracea]
MMHHMGVRTQIGGANSQMKFVMKIVTERERWALVIVRRRNQRCGSRIAGEGRKETNKLPWKKKKRERKKKCSRIKKKKIWVLCKSYPTEFTSYFHYCRSLRFEDKPDYSYLKRLFRDLFIREGYQFDYVFDWTILKYPQLRTGSRLKIPAVKTYGHAGPPTERVDKHSGKEVHERLIGTVEAFSRRNSSSGYADSPRHNSSEVMISSPDSLRGSHTSTRPSNTSRKGIASSSKASSSNGPSERSSRFVSGSRRLSAHQRLKSGSEPSRLGTPSRLPASNKGSLDDTVQNFEFLSIEKEKIIK